MLIYKLLALSFSCNSTLGKNPSEHEHEADLVDGSIGLIRIKRELNETSQLTQPESTKSSSNSTTKQFFELDFPETYNMHEVPKHPSGRPIEVFVQLNIRKVLDIHQSDESVKIDLEFRTFWTDYKIREQYNKKRINKGLRKISYDDLSAEERKNMTQSVNNLEILDKIWRPNLYFGNLLKVTQPFPILAPNTLKLIPEIGAFEYLTRISVLMDCPMDFHYYPADSQECFFSVRPFAYTKEDVILQWFKNGVWLHELEAASFDIKVEKLRRYSKFVERMDPLSDFYDVFEFRIKFRRRLSYHIVQTYLPSTFYIIITCLCFLLPGRFVEARIGIAMTTLLTLTAMFASVRDSTPIVSYVKAIDTWMAGCIMFVFLCLADVTFMTWVKTITEEYLAFGKKKVDQDEANEDLKPARETPYIITPNSFKKYRKLNNLLEKRNFQLFIAIMIVYSIVYWAWLLHSSDYFDWSVDERHNNVYTEPW